MEEIFDNYVKAISIKYAHPESSEMAYRTDFELLLKEIFGAVKGMRILHDARAHQGNKPDFIVLSNDVPLLYIEAKDIGVSLDKVEKSDQMARYFGYTNLILTDYTEFRFYRNGVRYEEPIKIAAYDTKERLITPLPQNYEHTAKSLVEFTQTQKEPIKSGAHLAKIMGGKAQRIRDNVRHFVTQESEKNQEILHVYETIKQMLVHDLTLEAFADMYAQTLVYGLFVARYYDETSETFSRQEARDLVPASNPFLQHFFDHIAGPNFDKRLSYIVDELCTVFQHSDTKKLIEDYMGDADPVIHFYEDFLKEYDSELRKKMGAYYTPLPVVRFIVRSVDQILKKEFNLSGGLADTSKLPGGQHRVQILDPAVGTGTFISATIRTIYEKFVKQGQKGRWPAYVNNDLLPRLHGFELMMAPYTIAHLKLSLAFKQTGFWKFHKRLGIYLTNSLEKSDQQQSLTSFGFAESIAEEAKEADKIKNETPIMVVIGNPPYSVSSSNKGEWIQNLIEVYKTGLNEQNTNSLSDDYVKFLRFAEHFIEKNKAGVVAMITNNSFIDGITHRQMRKHLLETFNDIYILDLHGNSKKKEKAPDGKKDENVFDIQQGVSISILVRHSENKNELGQIYHAETYGLREDKFKQLHEKNIANIKWEKLENKEPNFFFSPKNFKAHEKYDVGFQLTNLFNKFGTGIKFRKDNLLIKNYFNSNAAKKMLSDMQTLSKTEILNRYNFKETPDWKIEEKRKLFIENDVDSIRAVQYRPFDIRYTYYPLKTIGQIIPRGDSRKGLMANFFADNIGLVFTRLNRQISLGYFSVTKEITDLHILDSAADSTLISPLYIYSEQGNKTSNLKTEIVTKIEEITGKTTPEDIFDYIYAVLHSPSYREKYKEFLKIDFPRVPYPKDAATFKQLVALGTELRQLHLLESPKIGQFITTYPVAGSDTVDKVTYKDGNVFINAEQYFGNVPELAWNFYIGGYQPAQKWLKDRKGRTLTNEDIEHYQKIIVALTETDRLMKKIDQIFSA